MSDADKVAELERALSDERARRADAEQQRDVMADELRRLQARIAVEERIG